MKTIELTLSENQNQTIIFIDNIFEIRYKTPYTSVIVSVKGSKTEVNGNVEQIREDIGKMF